jgi:hypothetical protein
VAKNEIFGLLQRRFKDSRVYNSYKEEFLAEFYSKLIEYDNNNDNNDQPGLCDSVIGQIISVFVDESITYDKAIHYLDHVLQTIPLIPSGDLRTKQQILRNLYLQTLNHLPEDTRRKVKEHDKNLFENKMLTSPTRPPKDWFDNQKQNKNDYDIIVLCCTCKNKDCSHYNHDGTAICDYYTLISTVSLSDKDNSYSQMDCPECQTQRSIHIYNTCDDLIDSKRIRNNSF